jgi:hypothetical protein
MPQKFSKRHYIAIADVIAELRLELANPHSCQAAFTFADYAAFTRALASAFERDNPHFNRSRFLAACGLKGADQS